MVDRQRLLLDRVYSSPVPLDDKTNKMPKIVAHRGASKSERENTLAAFHAASAQGADMVELDVRRSADGKLIIHHDPHVVTEAGTTHAIVELQAVDLPPHVCTLTQALDACVGMEVNVEIKNDDTEVDFDASRSLADAVVEVLRARSDCDQMLVSSFDYATIQRVRELAPELDGAASNPLAAFIDRIADDGHMAIHPHRYAATAELIEAAHARNLAVNVWTVDKPEELRALTALGVDALITNTPDAARVAIQPVF
jgi:glycerophosphoryl diester phosphodiesterase